MKIITLFNHKGGVAKTTNCFNLGWKLAELGNRVILVDADSQCNLTGLSMGLLPAPSEDSDDTDGKNDADRAGADFEETQNRTSKFWEKVQSNNIHHALRPAFYSEPNPLSAVECLQIEGNPNLYLLPGSLDLADYESDLALAQSLQGAFGSQRNLPGAINALLRRTGENLKADYMIVDVSPSLGAINQNVVCISDQIVIPCAPDYFSVMALQSLASILPRWRAWAIEASSKPQLRDATYPFPEPKTRFSGIIVSRYVIYKKKPARAFETWISNVANECSAALFPALKESEMTFDEGAYRKAGIGEDYKLAQVREFNSLRPKSQEYRIPAFALQAQHLTISGQALENTLVQIKELNAEYKSFADTISRLP